MDAIHHNPGYEMVMENHLSAWERESVYPVTILFITSRIRDIKRTSGDMEYQSEGDFEKSN